MMFLSFPVCASLALLLGAVAADNGFDYPPPKGKSLTLEEGSKLNAKWHADYPAVNLMLYSDFVEKNGSAQDARLISMQPFLRQRQTALSAAVSRIQLPARVSLLTFAPSCSRVAEPERIQL